MSNAKEIGSFEAKTRLSELLRGTENGESYVILRRGKPVARLVPPEPAEPRVDYKKIAEDFKRLRESIEGTFDVVALVREGRDSRWNG